MRLGRERPRTWRVDGIVAQNFGIMFRNGPAARTGWRDDIVKLRKRIDDLPRNHGGVLVRAVIPRGLAATGLRIWHDYVAAGLFEKLCCREAHRGPHQVGK